MAALKIQQHPSEMANEPLRNVDKLINKELCHRQADSFINKVHTTFIMQTVAVSSTKITLLHAAAAMVCINHCSTDVKLCQSNAPLHFLFSQTFSKFSSGFFSSKSAAPVEKAAAGLTPITFNSRWTQSQTDIHFDSLPTTSGNNSLCHKFTSRQGKRRIEAKTLPPKPRMVG